ncbi:MAG: FAD-dependent oxidoreductase, partial [Proteobacteria bacterium]|nr:FAD-dependent oxidoreductase [Pseudomonadota bacterium]
YDAVVVATGCVNPRKLGVKGEDLENVYKGLDFMKAVNIGEKPFVGDKVVVIGAGFTAVDCARSAVRLGASNVSIHIRKTLEYMRIDETEKHEAQFEGIKTYSLIQPSKILGDNNKVTGVEFMRTRMEKIDKPPYRISVPIENSKFIVPADAVIAAIGQTPSFDSVSKKLSPMDKKGNQTKIDGVFAAGDFVSGSTDVISAIAGGRKCAGIIDEYLVGKKRKMIVVRLENHTTTDRPRSYDFIPGLEMNTIDMDKRLSDPMAEVETGLDSDQAFEEAKRCYLCNLKYEIDPLTCIYCSACIDVAPKNCIKLIENVVVNADGTYGSYEETNDWNRVVSIAIDPANCIRCGQCLAVCPMDCIHVTKTELIEIDI